MAKSKPLNLKCVVHFSEGWNERFTQALVDLYYERRDKGLTSADLKESAKK